MKYFLFALSMLGLAACSNPDPASEATPVVSVRVASVRRADIPIITSGPAIIFPKQQANVMSRITARIRQLRANKGDNVRAGETLAVLENQDLIAQRDQAQGTVEDASATLQKTLVNTLPADLARAKSQLDSAQAALDQAEKNLERRKSLFAQGAIPGKDLLQSQTDYTTAQAALASAKESYDVLAKHSKQDVRIAQSRLDQAKAQLAAARATLGFSEIQAPFSGTITEQFLYPGDMAAPSTPIFTIMDVSEFVARAQIPASAAISVRSGNHCTFSTGDANRTTWPGKVTVINDAVDPTRRTVETWCEIKPPLGGLKAGLFGAVDVQTGLIHDALIVPVSAVEFQEGTNHGTAMVVDSHDIAHVRKVEAGQRLDNNVAIKTGLNPNETVIVEGNYALSDGTHVRPERQQDAK
jgi:multidrug efflux pump subunit AcrA (membrane-fusion protein)